jgi:hypothetical protein
MWWYSHKAITVKLRAEAHVTIQASSLSRCYKPRHVTKQDVLVFINSNFLDFEVAVSNMP